MLAIFPLDVSFARLFEVDLAEASTQSELLEPLDDGHVNPVRSGKEPPCRRQRSRRYRNWSPRPRNYSRKSVRQILDTSL
jgi:hypothetical protein